jgi:hypothetical protein
MQDSLRSKWLGCSHVPSPSSPSRNLANGGWISLNSSTSPAFTESPSVSSRIGEGEESGSQPWHCRGVLWRDRGGAFGNLPIPSYRPTAQRHSRWHRAAQREWLSAPFQSILDNTATGLTAKGIKAAKLKRLPVAIPPLSEQIRIVAKVKELMTLCDRLESQLTTAKTESGSLLEAVLHQSQAEAS